jgi:hypothetical protein
MWITNDFKNSKLHRLIRIKTFNILMNNMPTGTRHVLSVRKNLNKDYSLVTPSRVVKEVDYEVFDFNICKPNLNPFANSLVNEVWPLLRMLYRTRGAYKIEINFDDEKDTREFSRYLGDDFNAIIKFEIDNEGNWKADFDFKYVQHENAWKFQQYAQKQSNSLKRILILSGKENQPLWSIDNKTGADMENEYNNTVDFSFDYSFNELGKW